MPSLIGAMAGVVVGATFGMTARRWKLVVATIGAIVGGVVLYYLLGAVGVP